MSVFTWSVVCIAYLNDSCSVMFNNTILLIISVLSTQLQIGKITLKIKWNQQFLHLISSNC